MTLSKLHHSNERKKVKSRLKEVKMLIKYFIGRCNEYDYDVLDLF